MEGVVENPPHPAPPADKKTTPIGIFLYIVAFWSAKNGILSGYGRPASERGAFIPTLEKQMKKKALTLAIAAALSAPASFAATDSDGMQYTRASEGFYGQVATLARSKNTKGGKSTIGFDAVRIGVRGTNDMGSGLTGFYQWESGVSEGQGDSSFGGRLAHWGVRGAFGQVQVGSFWTADYSFVHQADYVGVGEGAAGTYYDNSNGGARQARSNGPSLEYKTPDLNGFQGAVRLSTKQENGSDSTIGLWNLAARYEVQGFTVGASYNVVKDGLGSAATAERCTFAGIDATVNLGDPAGAANNRTCAAVTVPGTNLQITPTVAEATADTHEDRKTWSLGLGYAQDNWQVGGWYGTDNFGDVGTNTEDSKTMTLGGKVDIGKVGVFANWQRTDNYNGNKAHKRTYGGLGVGYTFTQQTGITGTYRLRDWEDQAKGSAGKAQNFLQVVMHHRF